MPFFKLFAMVIFFSLSAATVVASECPDLSGKYFGICKFSNGKTSKGRVVLKQDGCKSVKIANRLDFNRIWNHLKHINGEKQILLNDSYPSGNHFEASIKTSIEANSLINSNYILTFQNLTVNDDIVELENIQTEYTLKNNNLMVKRTGSERFLPQDKMITSTVECELTRKKR